MTLNKKTVNRVNGGFAIYYGISALLGAVAAVIATIIWVYKELTQPSEFSWGTFAGLLACTAFLGIMAYIILRIGYEQIEE